MANVLVKLNGQWYTPPLESGCLPGVGRGMLLQSGEATESVILASDLGGAEEIALVNGVRGRMTAQLGA